MSARIFPEELPSYIRRDPLRESEGHIFDLLKAQLDQSFTVYYSRYWFGLAPDGSEKDGEADFIIVHEVWGLLTIEVKGGAIEYDPTTGFWHTVNRWRIRSRIKDPFNQARTCKHRLLEKLNESTLHLYVRARHAIIFPDSEPVKYQLGWDKPSELICFANQLGNIGSFVRHRMGTNSALEGKERPLGKAGIAFFDDLLAKRFTLNMSLNRVLDQDESAFLTLSEQQFQVLEGCENQSRWAIAGAAGTGKTVLAREQVRRLSGSGRTPILLCCFNAPLCAVLARELSDLKSVEVKTFHHLCLVNGTDPSTLDANAENGQEIVFSPKIQYRAIVVDEGQDFHPAWWSLLEAVLAPDGQLFVYYDDRQKLFPVPSNFIKGMPAYPFTLARNLRNTRQIFDLAKPWISGSPPVSSWGPDGPPVLWQEFDQQGARNAVCSVLHELVEKNRIEPREIAVLCSTDAVKNVIQQGNKICGFAAHKAEQKGTPGITVDSVRRFKGLESRVVVLVLDETAIPEKELLYVALTRARGYLIIIGRETMIESLKSAAHTKKITASVG